MLETASLDLVSKVDQRRKWSLLINRLLKSKHFRKYIQQVLMFSTGCSVKLETRLKIPHVSAIPGDGRLKDGARMQELLLTSTKRLSTSTSATWKQARATGRRSPGLALPYSTPPPPSRATAGLSCAGLGGCGHPWTNLPEAPTLHRRVPAHRGMCFRVKLLTLFGVLISQHFHWLCYAPPAKRSREIGPQNPTEQVPQTCSLCLAPSRNPSNK